MEIKDKIENLISETLQNLQLEPREIVVEHPADLKMGDYSTSVAMSLAKKVGENPKELAGKIMAEIKKNLPTEIEKVEIAGAGFINFYLNKYFFEDSVKQILHNSDFGKNNLFAEQKMMVEYTDPNPFKPLHIGHLMTNAIGEAIVRVLEFSGAKVLRANYQGDVGLHVAKAIWGLLNNQTLQDKSGPVSLQAENIGRAYAKGSEAYETSAKEEIDEINKKIYDRSDEKVNKIYDWGFKVTMEAFEDIYRLLGTKFDHYFLESQMAPAGLNIVKDNVGKVFEKSDGATVFNAEKHDPKLHTRVFITSQGLPTYETKELGLVRRKFEEVGDLDLSIVVTANEQAEYMRVVFKALALIYPEYENKMKHITHGMMRFASGKMSSREGNVITGETFLRDVKLLVSEKIKDKEMPQEEKEKIASAVGVAAIKYGILKQSIGGDIIFDFEKATSLEGDSGPYLQYAYTRAKSILEKAAGEGMAHNFDNLPKEIFGPEKLLYQFPEVVLRCAEELKPHYVVNYLIELAQSFNNFYGNTKIIDKDDLTSPYKLALTEAFATVMKNGLHLLGIEAPERM